MTNLHTLQLVAPDARWRDSYCDLVREFIDRGERLVPFTLSLPTDDFPAFLARLSGCARGEGVPHGFVPHSTFWLVRDDIEVVGVSNLRHALTAALRRDGGTIGYGIRPGARRRGYAKELLRLTLTESRGMGQAKALLTCAKTNIGSLRTILHCGGRLESEEFLPERGEVIQRYVIDLGPDADGKP